MVDTLPPHTPYPRWEVTGTATEGYITINVMQSGNIDVKQEYKLGDNTLLKTLQAISTYVKQEPSTDPETDSSQLPSMETSSDPMHSTPQATATHSSAQSTATEEAKREQTDYRFPSEGFDDGGERIACQITVYLKELSAFNYNTDDKGNAPVVDSPKAWIVRVDEPPISELWPEHSFKVPKIEKEWDEENLNETAEDMEEEEMEDMEEGAMEEDELSDDEDQEGEDIDRFRQLLWENKMDPSQLALLKGLPVMTLDNLIARREFSEADVKKLIGKGETSYDMSRQISKRRSSSKNQTLHKNSNDPWLKPLAFTCNKCGQKFEKEEEQTEHEAHCTTDGVKCTQCDKTFDSVLELGKHMDNEHSD